MALVIGTRLNDYRIMAPSLGAEGMGEVHAVEDLNLGSRAGAGASSCSKTREKREPRSTF